MINNDDMVDNDDDDNDDIVRCQHPRHCGCRTFRVNRSLETRVDDNISIT